MLHITPTWARTHSLALAGFLLVGLSAFAANIEKEPYQHPNRRLANPGQVAFLSGPNEGEPFDIAMNFLHAHKAELGLTDRDLNEAIVSAQHTSKQSGTTHIYLNQHVAGIKIRNSVISIHIARDGSVINVTSNFLTDAHSKIRGEVRLLPSQAVNRAASALGFQVTTPLTEVTGETGADRATTFSDGGFARGNIPTYLLFQPVAANAVRPVWMVEIRTPGAKHHWHLALDAENGKTLLRYDTVIADRFEGTGDPSRNQALINHTNNKLKRAPDQYEVFEMPKEYPYDGTRTIQVDPADPTASPFGWHDTDGVAGAEFTITRGNNTHSFLDRDNNDSPDPGADVDGGATLDFTGSLVPMDLTQDPSTYSNAAVVNLFYWVNIIHDVTYHYGFDEASGNFQVNNYGNGGVGNDDVIAYAQKGADAGQSNNAFFGTPADGSRPEMLMLEWSTTTPRRDGDFSSGIMAHEFGHGVSNRLTGGGANVSCLSNGEQMGEGWSDFLGLVLTAKDTDTDVLRRGIGTYALGQPIDGVGIREAPYTTDMTVNTFTYGDVPGRVAPHGVGFVWCSILWEVYWALTNEYGFNPNFYADWSTGGNNLAIQLVLDGMKLQPCSPGFVDGRDAILQADVALTGGANQCLLWNAFAKRGLGFSADQGSSSSSTDGTEAFDIPISCDTFGVAVNQKTLCTGDDAVFDLAVGAAWSGPVTFSASGEPPGTTVAFSPNPITVTPGTVTMTISNTAGVTPGDYTISIAGTDGSTNADSNVTLSVYNAAPGAPSQSSPSDGAVDVSSSPTFGWNVAAQTQASILEVAGDPGFANIVFTATTGGTSATSDRLGSLTTYYWRLRATNPCGTSTNSPTFSFTTLEQPDYFTEQLEGSNDLPGHTVTFEPDGSGDFYSQCSEETTQFPSNPSGATTLTLGDDDSQPVTLGTPITLYGVSYGTVYVGSNGYLTFAGADNAYTETLAVHFNQPRVSAWFDDLNPTAGGTVSHQELADRFVVTYENIPEFNTTNQNNFQVELFHNGNITITHLAMASGDGISGLSEGGGIPGDYLTSDLTSCLSTVLPCPADLNGDRNVDTTDFGLLQESWFSGVSGDINGDGRIDIVDLMIFDDYLGTCP